MVTINLRLFVQWFLNFFAGFGILALGFALSDTNPNAPELKLYCAIAGVAVACLMQVWFKDES
jgi:membrane-associated PAP2 superfamily phosphatase